MLTHNRQEGRPGREKSVIAADPAYVLKTKLNYHRLKAVGSKEVGLSPTYDLA